MVRRLAIGAVCAMACVAAVGCANGGPDGTGAAPPSTRPATTRPAPPTTRPSTLFSSACLGHVDRAPSVPVRSALVTEASGIVASRSRPGWYWVHNDSGDVPRFFSVDPRGAVLPVAVSGAQAVDWEDMAPDHTSAGDGLWLADIGDNLVNRPNVVLYRVRQPAAGARSVRAAPLVLTYPDGPHNAEALLRDPSNGELLILTKEAGTARIYAYRPPATGGGAGRLRLVGRMRVGVSGADLITGGDIAPDRSAIAVRTYGDVWLYRLRPGEAVAAALRGSPCRAKHATEVQGEAVGFERNSRGYVTISEGPSPRIARFREAAG